jgi:excisionase family DNA binding protein
MNDFTKLLKAREAASLLAISERQLWQLTKDGKIQAIRLGKCVRYRVEDLKESLEKLTTRSV